MSELSIEQRARYLRGLLQRYGTLSLPLGSGLSFSLIQVFQPLRLRQSTMDESLHPAYTHDNAQQDEQENAEQQGETEEPAEPLHVFAENGIEALSKSPQGRLVILGGPGSGKTTVLKHLLYHHVQRALEESAAPLPIFLSLPDLARADQDLDAYLAFMARAMGLDANESQAFSYAIQQGHAFICLDSLDEVLPRLRPGIIHQINTLAQGSGNTWIIGSRFTDYKGGQFQTRQFQEWELQLLDEVRRLQLAEQLLPELHRQLPALTTPAPALSPHQYVQALSTHQQAASWGQNPLLFSLGAVVYLRRGTLSGSRAMLYCEVMAALLETREPDGQQRMHLHNLLAALALELYQIKGRTFSMADMRATLIHLNREQRATWDVAEALYCILNAGLLDVVSVETYSFRHQTFQEYLVASALARQWMSEDEQAREAAQHLAWHKHTYSRWQEIERLLVGILVQEYGHEGRCQAIAWLTRLLRRQSNPEGDPGHLSLELAIKLLGEVANLAEWQTEETLELEEEAATIWVKLATTPSTIRTSGNRYPHRLWKLAPEIGHLRPAVQEKAIQPLIQQFLNDHHELHTVLGLTHSKRVAEHLLAAWQADPTRWVHIGRPFTAGLQAYAPVDLVLPKLRDGGAYQIKAATYFLQELGHFTPVSALIAFLQEPRAETRRAAANILISVAEEVEVPVAALLSLWQPDAPGAFDVARVLARLHHPAGIELLQMSLQETSSEKRLSALEALIHLGTQASVEKLTACLSDPYEAVRTIALNMLEAYGPRAPLARLIEVLQEPAGGTVVTATIRALLSIVSHTRLSLLLSTLNYSAEPRADQVLVEALLTFYKEEERLLRERKTARGPGYIRRDILKTVSKLARHLPPPVVLLSFHEAKDRHANTAPVVEEDTTTSLAELIDLSVHTWPAREVAVHVLALDGAEKHLTPLLSALSDREYKVSWAAKLKLTEIAGLIPLEHLLQALQHPAHWVRRHALELLAKHHERPAVEPLIAALHNDHASVREAAATALANWTEHAPLEELVAATYDDYVEVRLAAAAALGKVGQRDPALAQTGILNALLQPGITNPDQVGLLASALQRNSPHAPSEPLLHAMYILHDASNNWLSGVAAEALATQGERMPVAELRNALYDADRMTRRLALIALGSAGAAAPVQELIALLDDPEREDTLYILIGTLSALWEYVPSAIFLRILRDETCKEDGGAQALTALLRQGEQIPEDILSWALSTFSFENQQMLVTYLATLNELPPIPYDVLLTGLAKATLCAPADSRHVKKAALKTLVPRFPLASLQAMLRCPDARIRGGVLLLLSYHPEELPQEALVAALLNDPRPDDFMSQARRTAIALLLGHSAPLPVQALLPFLRDSALCGDVLHALGTAGEHAPLARIMPFLNSSHALLRALALRALRQPGLLERTSTEAFLHATGDAALGVREAALKALKKKGQHLAIEHCLLELGSSRFNPTAFHILQELHPAIVPAIVREATELLQGGPSGRFFRSLSLSFFADILGKMERATPELMARLGEMLDWPYWEVRMKAVQALGKLQRNIPDATIRRLLELRHDPHSRAVREATEEALAEILSLEAGIEDD